MVRHRSRTIAPTLDCRELPSNCNSDEMAGIVVGDAPSAAPTKSGPSQSDRSRTSASTRDSVDQGLSDFSAGLNDQLRAIRRKLWIFNATLNALLAKIEIAYHPSAVRSESDMLDRSAQNCDRLGKDGVALKGKTILGCWPARWKCARLRARAVRAERRAAVAMNDASTALSQAFEAVLQYACACAEADESCMNITHTPTPRDCS